MTHRAGSRLFLSIVLVGLIALGVVMVTNVPVSSESCVLSSTYGKQCVTISGSGLTVTTIQGQFTTFPDFFTQHAWTFATTTYQCDPRGRTKSACPPDQRTYGTIHAKDPRNTSGTACTLEGAHIGGTSCTGSLQFPLPHTFQAAHWLCVEVAVRVDGKLVDDGAGIPAGNRACRHVH